VKAVQQPIKPEKASKPTASAASPKNAFSWILLKDALALITDAYQNSGLAQRTLCKAFVELQVRNRAARAEGGWICEQGQWKEHEHNLRLGDLWRREFFAPNWTPYGTLQIHWQNNSARLLTEDAGPVTFYRIEVAREDLLKLLPEGYELPSESPSATATLVSPQVQPEQTGGSKRGQKGYSERDLKKFEVKFYQMLAHDDVQPEDRITYSDYGEKLERWGKDNGLEKVPTDKTLAERISKVWWPDWLSIHGHSK
jgi:hypothetical protein